MPRRKPPRKVKKRIEAIIETCTKCKEELDKRSIIIDCDVCKGPFHKIKCGGRPRYHMDKFTGRNEKKKKVKNKKKADLNNNEVNTNEERWICEECLKPTEQVERETTREEQIEEPA